MTIVFLSDNKIRVASGVCDTKAVVSDYAVLEGMEDCYSNGQITDAEAFSSRMAAFFNNHGLTKRDVKLVLRTNRIIHRLMDVPAKDRSGMYRYIANDFADVDRASKPVFAYQIISENKGRHDQENRTTQLYSVLAAMMDKEYIDDFCATFMKAGIKIDQIEPQIFGLIRVLSDMKEIENKTAIVQLMDINGYVNMLFVNGEYVYSNYNRLSNEVGTLEFGVEVARGASNLIQFAKAQKINERIERIYYGGFDEPDVELARDAALALTPGVATKRLNNARRVSVEAPNKSFEKLIIVAGSFLTASPTEDFMTAMELDEKKSHSMSSLTKGILLICLTLVVMVGITIGVFLVRDSFQRELDDLNGYIQSAENIKQNSKAEGLKSKNGILQSEIDAADKTIECLKTYPVPNSKVNKALEKCASNIVEAEVMQYNSETGQLVVSCLAKDVETIHKFVAVLRKDKTFTVIDYSGYEYIEETKKWSVNVIVLLNKSFSETGKQGSKK